MDDKETLNRRARLRELIACEFESNDQNLLRFIAQKTGKMPNQGELSSIQKDNGKSFGDKKAKKLTEQIGLHRRWFDLPVGTNVKRSEWLNEPNIFSGELMFIDSYRKLTPNRKTIAEQTITGLLASQYAEENGLPRGLLDTAIPDSD